MISVLHLLWIIPVAASIGYMTAVLMVAAKEKNCRGNRDRGSSKEGV